MYRKGFSPTTKIIDGEIHKHCSYCKEHKPLTKFYPHKKNYLGTQNCCKKCTSEYSKKRNTKEKNRESTLQKYNLTPEQYAQMYESQEGKCAICWKVFELLNVDHDHETEQVRGLLCENCNKGLGYFKDDLFFIANAFNYLLESMINQ